MGVENGKTTSAFYVRVRGRVQGVGFRYSAVQEAHRLKINGWVRNDSNGDVEVWAEGPEGRVAAFLEWLQRGPRYSRVDSIEKNEKNPKGYYDFNVEY